VGTTADDRAALAAYDAAKAADNGVRVPLSDLLAEILDTPITESECAEAREALGHPAA
jgi:hypothetical protein